MTGLLFSEYTALRCLDIGEMRRGRIERLVKALSLAAEKCQLLHREHYEGVSRENEQSTLDFGIGEQDAVPPASRIELDGIEGLEE